MKSMEWKLADAKNKFSELVNRALTDGPQIVRRRGDTVYVLSEKDFVNIQGGAPSLKHFLLAPGPDLEGLDLRRDKSLAREIEL